jgi:hypothetical protein
VKICPHCRDCEGWCRREAAAFRPFNSGSLFSAPSPTQVYSAIFDLYSKDRTILDTDEWHVAMDLVEKGYLKRPPLLVDVGHALDLAGEIERPKPGE